jgi:hypothetical protein
MHVFSACAAKTWFLCVARTNTGQQSPFGLKKKALHHRKLWTNTTKISAPLLSGLALRLICIIALPTRYTTKWRKIFLQRLTQTTILSSASPNSILMSNTNSFWLTVILLVLAQTAQTKMRMATNAKNAVRHFRQPICCVHALP